MTHKVNRKLLDDGTIALRALEPADLDAWTNLLQTSTPTYSRPVSCA